IVVLDIDGPKGETLVASIERQYGPLPTTPSVKTSKGRHLCFTYPKGVKRVKSISRKKLNLDVRGDGGYVVAPPSTHESGHIYSFINSDITRLAECPTWVVAFANGELRIDAANLSVADRASSKRPSSEANSTPPPWSEAEEARLLSALACIPAIERDVWLKVG